MLLDLNYYPADKENYIAKQPSGSNFRREYFQTTIKSTIKPIPIKLMIKPIPIKPTIKLILIQPMIDRHRGIKEVFERSHLGWSVQRGGVVHWYCMQHVVENLYKEAEKSGKKEDNLRDDFRKRLANKKKPRRFIER
jgi:hypothetical protein